MMIMNVMIMRLSDDVDDSYDDSVEDDNDDDEDADHFMMILLTEMNKRAKKQKVE